MGNVINHSNITVSEETYLRLKQIKETNNWTFNETLDKLCELEFKNNYITRVQEFVLITETINNMFRITFKKENIVVEYYNFRKGYTKKIDNWELDKKIKNEFLKFIKSDYARCMLEHLPVSIEFEDFIIKKL